MTSAKTGANKLAIAHKGLADLNKKPRKTAVRGGLCPPFSFSATGGKAEPGLPAACHAGKIPMVSHKLSFI